MIETAEDALAVTLHETGLVDLDRIAELLGRSRETAIAELGERIFLDPEATVAQEQEIWVTADAYLSGKIRDKLTAAQAAAALDPRYQRNVAALEKTLPEDLKPSDITARLGAPWIPADVVAAFAEEVLGVKTPVYHTVEIASWSINVHAFAGLASSSTDWGTSRRHAGELLMDALNASLPQIYDEFEEDGVKKRVLNAADTEAAQGQAHKIKAAFETWVWKDVERADRLARIYNDRFNNLVPRHFDGSHLTIPGASSVISFYAHQKRAIWRIVASGTTYVAHAVGAGKTFTPRRRDHGAEAARSDHQGDDGRARPLPRPGEPRVPAALSDRPNPGRRRDQFRQGQAPAVSGARRDRAMGLHHHHPFGVQVHTLPAEFERELIAEQIAVLFRPARASRRRRPALAQAHRADEGGLEGGPRAAEVAARTTC